MNAWRLERLAVLMGACALVGCDGDVSLEDASTRDAGERDGGATPPPALSEAMRAMLGNPVEAEHAYGEWMFYRETWDSEQDGSLPPPEFLVELWRSDPDRWGEQFSAYGFLVDPDDDLPIGLARGTGDPTRTGRTCAICHVARLPDGRVWTGFPAVELRINQFAVDVDAAWVAAGNEPRLTPEDVERRSLLPQPGIDSVTGSDSPYLAPVDFPFYLNFGRRSLFGSDGNARDARSAILVSIFGFRGSDNPVPFPRDARTEPFVDFLMTLETPLPLEPPDATLVERGRAVFAEARCDSCHHPEDQAEERVVDWVEAGPERLPGEDPDHPNGTIATDGERYQMTTFSGGVDESREAFAIFIARNGLRVGPSDGYIPRDIHAAFASAPFLHNGSVPTLEDLLRPAAERPTTFVVRGVEVDTTVPGMSNAGHEFGTALPDADREALIAYLESL